MSRPSCVTAICLAAVVGCSEPASDPLSPIDVSAIKSAAAPGDPTATWKIPLADARLSLRSDGASGDGTYSVYANGVCGVSTRIFATESGSNSGDATIQTSEPKGKKCGRRFRLVYPDGGSDLVASFNNLNKLQSSTSSIPVDATELRRFIVNPGVTGSASRCGRLIFGDNGVVGEGTDQLLVKRTDKRTWEVSSQEPGKDRALCEKLNLIYNMPVSFVVVASRDLP